MRNWEKTCEKFKNVRNLINMENLTIQACLKILTELEKCCDEIAPSDNLNWIFYDTFHDFKTEIQEEKELMNNNDDLENCINTIDYILEEFYDLCDCAQIWLAL